MATYLKYPFPSLAGAEFLSLGAAGQVFAISSNVVFKFPHAFENPAPCHTEMMEEGTEKMGYEREMYKILMKHRHPNILHCILCIPEGIFLPRMASTLESRLTRPSPNLSLEVQKRWIRQLSSALAWLERLGYVHGDLRPENILLDVNENIRLTDFDASVKVGEELRVGGGLLCKLNENHDIPLAGPETEQFAFASCIYNIRFGYEPHHDVDGPTMLQKMIKNEFPSTSADFLFGQLTTDCWHGIYDSIASIEQDILLALEQCRHYEQHLENGEHPEKDTTQHLEDTLSDTLLRECESFLAKETSMPKVTCR